MIKAFVLLLAAFPHLVNLLNDDILVHQSVSSFNGKIVVFKDPIYSFVLMFVFYNMFDLLRCLYFWKVNHLNIGALRIHGDVVAATVMHDLGLPC